MRQKTLKHHTEINGVGLHSGKNILIRLFPAADGGVFFRLRNKMEIGIEASYRNVVDTNLGTTVSIRGTSLRASTIEHLMAAIWACDIDNLIVEMESGEIPIMDGSARYFIDIMDKCGIIEFGRIRKFLKIKKRVAVGDSSGSIEILPSNGFSIDMEVDFNYGKIGVQRYFFNGNRKTFRSHLARARTFCNIRDIDHMRSIGLAQGGSMENAMVFDENGLLNPGGFLCPDEVVKHKVLDCVGDMFTSGYRIRGAIVARKSGHRLNNKLLQKIFDDDTNYTIE
jgi:UDP-3-O-[3-hydroxymyristoyl] N-acetylglucosamine deacetylase